MDIIDLRGHELLCFDFQKFENNANREIRGDQGISGEEELKGKVLVDVIKITPSS